MSHITTIQTEFYDWEILLETLRGLAPIAAPRGFCPVDQKLELRLKGVDEPVIRFSRKAPDAAFRIEGLVEDLDKPEIKRLLNDILQDYARRKILAEARKKGFALARQVRGENGEIKLVLRKVA